MTKNHQRLIYFLAETHFSEDHSVLVVSIVGPLVKENVATFRACFDEILKCTSKWVVLNFRDVTPTIDPTIMDVLNQLQSSIRQKPGLLRLSGLHPELRVVLSEKKIILPEEVQNNLAEALESFPIRQHKNKAA